MVLNNNISSNIPGLPSVRSCCPKIMVGIMDHQKEVRINLQGPFTIENARDITGVFVARAKKKDIVLYDEQERVLYRAQTVRLLNRDNSFFTLFNVTIGIDFHWEKQEEQTFKGGIVLKIRTDSTLAVINEIDIEDYLESVISSEMNSSAPFEFLKAHAIISRSWLISALRQKKEGALNLNKKSSMDNTTNKRSPNTIIRWYEQEGHDIYDVCADDHCQRYQGITKIITNRPLDAVKMTYGVVITYDGEVCDARYSKACGGITEEYRTAWKDTGVPYLISISDGPRPFKPITTETGARDWINSKPEAYCNTDDINVLMRILPDFDLKTEGFFRWRVEYTRCELEEIIREKSGYDIGTLKEITPIERGPSGRISLIKIKGSKMTITLGKELEIRRWLSRSHLYSSAFVIDTKYDPSGEVQGFTFSGAGWGHGVGLCQIGAAIMAIKGFKAEDILRHYFPGTLIERIY